MADCCKTVDFIKEQVRMCNSYSNCRDGCPFARKHNGHRARCGSFVNTHTDEAIQILQKWSDEHPEQKPKTYADVFFEKFPKALRDGNDPGICIEFVFGNKPHEISCDDPSSCHRCWNEPYTEQEASV